MIASYHDPSLRTKFPLSSPPIFLAVGSYGTLPDVVNYSLNWEFCSQLVQMVFIGHVWLILKGFNAVQLREMLPPAREWSHFQTITNHQHLDFINLCFKLLKTCPPASVNFNATHNQSSVELKVLWISTENIHKIIMGWVISIRKGKAELRSSV